MDEATLELRRKIEEMLLAAEQPETNFSATAANRPDSEGGHGVLGAFRMEDFAVKGPPVRDEREEIQSEVRGIIKSCLLVEDAAAEIKKGKPLSKHQRLYQEPPRPPPQAKNTAFGVTMTKQKSEQ